VSASAQGFDGARPPFASTRGETAYRALKTAIQHLQLEPGTSFSEAEIAAELGLSKTPVRDALARLRREGLVESSPRSGYRVTRMTIKDARALFGLRTLLEGEAAALAAGQDLDRDALHDLDELCLADYDRHDSESIEWYLGRNATFHLSIARVGGNDRLVEVLAQTVEQLERYMHAGLAAAPRAQVAGFEHRDLLAAILSGDKEAARRTAREHAHHSHAMVVNALLESDAVLSANLVASPTQPRHR